MRDLEAIMTSLQRDPAEALAMLNHIGTGSSSVSFDEFIQLMQQVENKIIQNQAEQ